jgi:hypothetical protein
VLVAPVDPVAPVGPVGPCFKVKSNTAAVDVPVFVTDGKPVGPVERIFPTVTVAADPVGPVEPVAPVAPCTPVAPWMFPTKVHALEIQEYKAPLVKM